MVGSHNIQAVRPVFRSLVDVDLGDAPDLSDVPEFQATPTFSEFEDAGKIDYVDLSDVQDLSDVPDFVPTPTFSDFEDGDEVAHHGMYTSGAQWGQSSSDCHISFPEPYESTSNSLCGGMAAQGVWAARVDWPPPKAQLTGSMLATLNAKKVAMADVVAQLSVAALEAEGRSAPMQKSSIPRNVELTTVMLRNVPLQCPRSMLLEVLNSEGFVGCYDFAYLPHNFETRLNFGFAFVNLVNPHQAELVRQHFDGFTDWGVPCEKPCETSWSDPYQGLAANVERYRNSPVMHGSVADEFKPILFDPRGTQLTFPGPTRTLRAPKAARRSSGQDPLIPSRPPAQQASDARSPGRPAAQPVAELVAEQSTCDRFNQLFFNLMDS